MHWTQRIAIYSVLFLFFTTFTRSQSPAPENAETAADRVYQAHDWKASEAAYAALTKSTPRQRALLVSARHGAKSARQI
jgi:hypothetical protein